MSYLLEADSNLVYLFLTLAERVHVGRESNIFFEVPSNTLDL